MSASTLLDRWLPTPRSRRIAAAAAGIVLLGVVAAGVGAWIVFGSNTPAYDGRRSVIVSGDAPLSAAVDSLEESGVLDSRRTFRWVAEATGWGAQIKTGHYVFASGASNYRILDVLRRGLQTPVRLTIPPGSRPDVVARVAASELAFSRNDFLRALRDTSVARSAGTDTTHLFGYMMPETYEFYWQTPPERVIRKIKRSFDRFYEREIAAAADSLDLTKEDVVTLASIVEREALLDEEKPTIAGVYLNRLDRGWRLQADPTVQYVLQTERGGRVRRVLNKHLEIEHPYNTYRIRGLPPGPITNPAPSTVRAVAAPHEHSYMYFAADGTGGHAFAETHREHLRNARAYHRLLDQRERERRRRQRDQ
jgi:UPF0755 protein